MEGKVGYSNATFEIDGFEASYETISEAVERGCEESYAGNITLNVQDKSDEGLSE